MVHCDSTERRALVECHLQVVVLEHLLRVAGFVEEVKHRGIIMDRVQLTRTVWRFGASSLLALGLAQASLAAPIVSDFEIDSEGWLVGDSAGPDLSQGTLTHMSSGGNPSGFI